MWKPTAQHHWEERLGQLYETSIGDRGSGHAFKGIVVPSRSIVDTDNLSDRGSLLRELHLIEISRIDPKFIVPVIAASLEQTDAELFKLIATGEELRLGHYHPTTEAVYLAERVSNEKFIPFENSPLDLHSLKDLIAKGTGTAIGAYVGFVALNSHPLVLVVVPAGIIVCGAAYGVAKALEEGLQYRLLGFMGVPTRATKGRTPPTGSGGSSQKRKPPQPDASTGR